MILRENLQCAFYLYSALRKTPAKLIIGLLKAKTVIRAIIDSGLCLRFATHDQHLLVFVVEQNLVGISAVCLPYFVST